MTNSRAAITQLPMEELYTLLLRFDSLTQTWVNLRPAITRLVKKSLSEEELDALALKKAIEEDNGAGWENWETFKKKLKKEGLI